MTVEIEYKWIGAELEEQLFQFGVEIFHHQVFRFLGEGVLFLMDDILPYAAEGGIPVEVFIDLAVLHLAKRRDQLPVEFGKGIDGDEFGEIELFGLCRIAALFFIAFTRYRIQLKSGETLIVEIEDHAKTLRIPDRFFLFDHRDRGLYLHRAGTDARYRSYTLDRRIQHTQERFSFLIGELEFTLQVIGERITVCFQ